MGTLSPCINDVTHRTPSHFHEWITPNKVALHSPIGARVLERQGGQVLHGLRESKNYNDVFDWNKVQFLILELRGPSSSLDYLVREGEVLGHLFSLPRSLRE